MARLTRLFAGSPRKIAISYLVFGLLWIAVTDQLVFAYAPDTATVTQLQTAKGWIFVFLSSALVYGLVRYSQRDIQATNERLDRALQQTEILHRLLRHNVRNSCNVIQGYATLLAEAVSGENEVHAERIRDQSVQLRELSETSKQLRAVVSEEAATTEALDLVAIVDSEVARLESTHPAVEVRTDLPDGFSIETDPRIQLAVREVLENAVEHNDSSEPAVRVRLIDNGSDMVSVEIADDGPGLPPVEQQVFDRGVETPLVHSTGLGLWISRTILEHADGTLAIESDEVGGTTVRIVIPTA